MWRWPSRLWIASTPKEDTGQPGQLHTAHGAGRWSPFLSSGRKLPSTKRRGFNPFTPLRENKLGKKRSRRSQKSRKYRKLDMGCFMPSTVVSTWPTISTTTSVNLSVPSNPPSTLKVPAVPKLPVPSQPSKAWAKRYPTPVTLSSLCIQIGPQGRLGWYQAER